jgi:hypothetical protein
MSSAVLTSWARLRRASLAFVAICAVASAVALALPGTSSAAGISLVLSSSTQQAAVGQPVSFTVSVSDANGAAGYVAFKVNGTQVATATIAVSASDSTQGTASWTPSAPLASGSNTVQALYYPTWSTIAGVARGSSNTVTVNVSTASLQAPTISLSATPTDPNAGDSVTLAVTVSGSAGTPTGDVAFYDTTSGGTPALMGTKTLDASGKATLVQSGFQNGTHSFTATYLGDGTYSSVNSETAIATVTPAATAYDTAISAHANPNPVYGGTTTLYASVVQAGTPTAATGGEVSFWNADNGAFIASVPVDANGNAQATLTGWLPGDYTIRATYVGTIQQNSSSATFALTFLSGSPTPVTVTGPAATAVYGGTIPASFTPTYSGLTDGDAAPATPATCTTSATSASPAGTYPITCSGADDIKYAFTYVDGSLTIAPAPLAVNVPSATMTAGSAVPALTPTITGFVNGDGPSVVSGAASCTTTATSASAPGTYPVTCTTGTLSAANYTFGVVGTGTVTVTAATADTRIVDWVAGPIEAGKPVLLTATLFAGSRPLGGKTVTLSLGSASCTAVTLPLIGTAFCLVTAPSTPLGPTASTATFAGDASYAASSDTNQALLYAFPTNGHGGSCAFVVGDRSDSGHVTFWGAQWAKQNSFSHGAGSGTSAFKGFAGQTSTGWSDGGSGNPPSSLPAYMGVLVASSVSKHGSSISGDIVRMVIVKTDAGYDGNPGHAGTGTVVASL